MRARSSAVRMPDALESARERLRAADIGVDQAPVEMERAGEALENLRGPALEAPAPELHACAAGLPRCQRSCSDPPSRFERRPHLIGRPIRLMKPSASFWS